MYVGYALSAIAFCVGLWYLTIAVMSCIPRCRRTAVGTLTKAQTWKNVKTDHGNIIPFLTKYRYVYTVKNRTYTYKCEAYHSKRRLFPKVTMVYVVGFPQRAYPNRFTGIDWVWGLLWSGIGILLLVTCLRGW